jgi:hypothetical protein
LPDPNPESRPATAPACTDTGPDPGTFGINISEPSAVLDIDNSTPLALASRAAGSA